MISLFCSDHLFFQIYFITLLTIYISLPLLPAPQTLRKSQKHGTAGILLGRPPRGHQTSADKMEAKLFGSIVLFSNVLTMQINHGSACPYLHLEVPATGPKVTGDFVGSNTAVFL